MQTSDTTMRIARLTALIGLSLLGACTTGNPPPDPTGRLCSMHYSLSGSFTASQARPANNTDGCWPVGTWTFTAKVDTTQSNTCSPAPMTLPSYQFEGDLATDPNDPMGPPVETFKYDTDPTATDVVVKVTEGGAGSCAGELDLWDSPCKHVWVFQPETDTIDAMTTLSGQAEYNEFSSAQCPAGDPGM